MHPYPDARRDETLPDDPYRWLEDADAQETAAFIQAQNEVAEPFLAQLPMRERFRESLTKLLTAPRTMTPAEHGGWLYAWRSDGRNQPVLLRSRTLSELDEGETVLDPNALSDDGTIAVTVTSFNQDGSLLAYATSDGGSDWRTLHVLDLESLQPLPDTIEWAKWNRPEWMPGGRSFTYWAYPAPEGNALTDQMEHGQLRVHGIGESTEEDAVLWESDNPQLFARHYPSDDYWFVLSTDTGSSSGNDLSVAAHDDYVYQDLVTGHEHEWTPIGIRDDHLFVVTDADSPRYRLVTFDLFSGEQSTIVQEHDKDVLLDADLTSDALVLTYSHDASHRAQLFALDGTPGERLPLPEGVSVVAVNTSDESATVFVGTQSFVDSGTVHRIDTEGTRVTSRASRAASSIEATTERIRPVSKDGTVVPAFVVRKEPTEGPTLIWGYGGFNIPMNPEFRAVLAAWVAAGGTLVVPNLRGGGEFGSDWHRAGTLERKQNVFDDLFAVAEYVREHGIASKLALHGRSNGGLLAGAALTQRPDLWDAVLPGVGVLDMLRYHLFTIGWAWKSDFGDPDDPEAAEYLRAYSPLHNLREGTAYPPTLITTADRDDRVVPAHSLKFAAELQRVQSGDAPVLLSVDTRAGHGMGKPKDAQAAEFADQLAFAAYWTGLQD